MERESDELLYDRYLKKRGEEDLRVLFSRHGKKLTLFLLGFVGDMRDAEELMLDAFAAAAAGKTPFFGKSSFKTWLYAIARHISYDCLKRSSRGQTIPIDELYDISDEEDIEREYIRQEDRITLHRALKRLNPDYSQVLYLTYFEDFDNSETAEIMKKSKRQIENLLYRAKGALKSELEKEGFEYERL